MADGDYVTRDEMKLLVKEMTREDHDKIVTMMAQASLMRWAGPIVVAVVAILIGALR